MFTEIPEIFIACGGEGCSINLRKLNKKILVVIRQFIISIINGWILKRIVMIYHVLLYYLYTCLSVCLLLFHIFPRSVLVDLLPAHLLTVLSLTSLLYFFYYLLSIAVFSLSKFLSVFICSQYAFSLSILYNLLKVDLLFVLLLSVFFLCPSV